MNKSKKTKSKYYAIKAGKGVKNKIVRSWSECKELVHGYPAIYKSFLTEEEALKYLGSIKEEDVAAIKETVKKHIETSKKKKATTRSLSFRVPKEVYDGFIAKVETEGYDKDKVLTEMLKEWIY